MRVACNHITMKKLLIIALVVLVFGACNSLPVNTSDITITINPSTVEMVEGDCVQLTATVSEGADITWHSSNESVATVSPSGVVTALAKGGTIITAEAGGASATCLVAVYIKAPKVVDLGLSVGWASCNVGATSPEEFGDHYAWGEVEPKEYYGWDNYKWKGSVEWSSVVKYSAEFGLVILEPGDDVAHVSYGGKWRMPTKEEMEELIANCYNQFVELKGVKGVRYTSKQNGNTIFIPLAGYKAVQNAVGPVHEGVGQLGDLWSSSFQTVSQAYNLDIGTGGFVSITTVSVGYSVRGVLP